MSSSVETENAIGKTDKEEIITPYPEQEFDVDEEYHRNEEGHFRRRDHRSILQRIAGVEKEIIEYMYNNSVRSVYRAVDYLQYWMPHYEGNAVVDEAAANLKRRIKAGINVMSPSNRLTNEGVSKLYRCTFTEQEEP